MTAFIVGLVKITDPVAYQRYFEAFPKVFAASGGRVLAADEAAAVIEGSFDADKVVLMQFPDAAAARAFLDSADYQRISQDRMAGAQTTAFIVHGF
jgi:uncharacterized protein (DUF1330 family)